MPKTTKDTSKQTTKKEKIDSKVVSKKETTTKKATTTKKDVKTATSKKTSTKKTTNSTVKRASSSTKQKTSCVKKEKTATKKIDFVEYYDLPYRYNQTIVKVLAQTPEMLFVYWDISDEDRLSFNKIYGENFFSKTKPVLLVHNETMNYTFEVEINDFANSWYLHVKDSNCKYTIELGRRPNSYQDIVKAEYIYVTSSNKIDAPNDHILFEKFNPKVSYRNIKTGEISKKDFSHLSNFKNMQKIYGIYDLYKEIYKNELFDEIVEGNLSNSSSSQFK